MRKVILLVIFYSLLITNCIAQWQPDIRLTNNTASSLTSKNNAWCVAANGNFVHVVWHDNRDGNTEIYYKRSTDGGISWAADTRLTVNSSYSNLPSISVSGQVVHVIWYDYRDGNYEIYYKRSPDAGVSWGTDTRLTVNSAYSWYLSVSVSGLAVHVVWEDNRNGNWEIYYKRSPDGGISWGTDTRLTNNPDASYISSVSVSGQVVHVVWSDNRDGNYEVYYKRSPDGGISWGTDTRLTVNSAYSGYPSVSVSGQSVHVVCEDERNGNWEIYYKRSLDGGISWGADTRLTNNSAVSWSPSISVSGQAVHVVYEDDRDGNFEIYYKRSTDGGVSWTADTRLTNNPGISNYPSLFVSGETVHVVWQDNRDGNYEIYYKRNPTGNPVGIVNVGSEIPNEYNLYQNYPNPFNPVTNVRFQIPKQGFVQLKIFNILGREIATLVDEELNPGTYEVNWDAANYPSGVYYYKLAAGEFMETMKMVLIK